MPLAAGEKLGPYEIVGAIGAGGMGEVLKARDTRLNRNVAIKFSKEKFSDRFEREAQAIAALNHPNICSLYDVGPNYLVMELVEGETLAQLIQRGPLPITEAKRYAGLIAEALDAAHEKGIVHRDLKPGNIQITPEGVLKVLDFGLAKVGAGSTSASGDPNHSPTLTLENATAAGVVLGTAAYMPPEQARGKPVDKRADVWAFGVVVYEMLTGERLFDGESVSDTLAAVLMKEPQWDKVPAPALRLLKRCLERDPRKRLRDIGDAMALWEDNPKPVAAAAPAAPSRARWLWPAIAAVLFVMLGVTAWALWPRPAPPARATRFDLTLPENVQFNTYLSVSPDGRKVVFSGTGQQPGLWIRDLDNLEWRRLAGTEGGGAPFWSPDSRFLGFAVGNQLKKIEVAGGPPQTLCAIPQTVGTGAWNKDGVIVFGTRGGGAMRRVSSAGGVPVDLTVLDPAHGEVLHALPTFLPDGKHFLYLRSGAQETAGIYVGSVDAKPAEQSRDRILANGFGAPYVDGNLFFIRDNTLMRQPFDAGRLQLQGEPVPVAEHVGTVGLGGLFSVSPSGTLAYRTGAAANGSYQPTWFDRQGKATGTFGQLGPDQGFVFSPDGTRAAVRDVGNALNGDIWLLDFARGVRTRLTFRQSPGSRAVWSPDGKRIIFSAGGILDTLFEKTSSGEGPEKELFKKQGEIKQPSSWSRDGRFLLYAAGSTTAQPDLWLLPLEGDQKPVKLLGTEFVEVNATFSPDMRWIAYISTESGRSEVYVRPFVASGPSGPALGEGKWQVSKDGSTQTFIPKWTADGKELIFRAIDGSPMAVDVGGSGSAFQAGIPKQLFAAPPAVGDWDVTADGKRFLMGLPTGGVRGEAPITVVLNWAADVKR